MSCALEIAVTAPVGSRLAITVSTYPLICTTPRLKNTGTKLRKTSPTWVDEVSQRQPASARRRTLGIWTASCNALPATDPQASSTASRGGADEAPNQTSVAIIAAFHIT